MSYSWTGSEEGGIFCIMRPTGAPPAYGNTLRNARTDNDVSFVAASDPHQQFNARNGPPPPPPSSHDRSNWSTSAVSFVAASASQQQFEKDELARIARQGPSMPHITDSMAILREVQRTAAIGTSGIGYVAGSAAPQHMVRAAEFSTAGAAEQREEPAAKLRRVEVEMPATAGITHVPSRAPQPSADSSPSWTQRAMMNAQAPPEIQAFRQRHTVMETNLFVVVTEPCHSRFGLVHLVVLPRYPSAPSMLSLLNFSAVLAMPPQEGMPSDASSSAPSEGAPSEGVVVTELRGCVKAAMELCSRVPNAVQLLERVCGSNDERQLNASTAATLQQLYGRNANKTSIVFRCGFFRTQVDKQFDIPCALHLISADLLGPKCIDSKAKLWNAVFLPDHLVSIDDVKAMSTDGAGRDADDLKFLTDLQRRLSVCTPMVCPVCNKQFQEVEELTSHWRKKCLVALSAAGGGEPITV